MFLACGVREPVGRMRSSEFALRGWTLSQRLTLVGVSGWTSLRFADVDFEPLLHAGQHQRVHVSAGTGPISPLHLATVAHPHDAAQHAHVGRHVQASIQPAVPCIFDLAAPSALEQSTVIS